MINSYTATLISNGTIILKNSILNNSAILIEDGKITRIAKNIPCKRALRIDAAGHLVAPGFIDSHIHGDPGDVLMRQARFGTTSIVQAISCADELVVARKMERAKNFKDNDPLGGNLLGVRLEGPFINVEKAGAQDKRFIKKPSVALLSRILKNSDGLLKIMTVAPEAEGAIKLIRMLDRRGVIPSIGHSNATYKEAALGVKAGICHATHLFNAMSRMTGGYRDDRGAAGAVISHKRLYAEVILDLKHVSAELFKMLLRRKDHDRIILVTDSIASEKGLAKLRSGVYKLKDGTTAGSSLTMIKAVENAVRECGASLPEAVRFATLNPTRLLNIHHKKGSLTPGKDADIVIFDRDFNVKMTIARGKIVYRSLRRGAK